MKKLRKNPLSDLYKNLKSLKDKNVIVRYRTNCLYFQVEGKLQYSTYNNIYEVWDQTNKKIYNFIRFDRNNVDKIINNEIIELDFIKQTEDEYHYGYSLKEIIDKLQELLLTKENIVIYSNFASSENSKISGKLKYNKSNDIYYVKNKELKSLINFGPECVRYVSYHGRYVDLDLNK